MQHSNFLLIDNIFSPWKQNDSYDGVDKMAHAPTMLTLYLIVFTFFMLFNLLQEQTIKSNIINLCLQINFAFCAKKIKN